MTWFRSLTSVVFVMLAIFIAYVMAYLPFRDYQSTLQGKIHAMETEIATLETRFAGLENSGIELVFPKELLWVSESKADVELTLQDAIVDLAGQFEITLITFGASGLSRDSAQKMVSFEFEAEGALERTYAFLSALEELNPKVAIGMFRMRPAQSYSIDFVADVLIYSQITIWAFWDEAT